MFRFYVASTATFAKVRALKLSVRKKTANSKLNHGTAENDPSFAKDEFAQMDDPDPLKIKNHKIKLKEISSQMKIDDNLTAQDHVCENGTSSEDKEMDANETVTVNEYKRIMDNLETFSIFGSEETESFGIQCDKKNNLSIPSVTHILSETMSAEAKLALQMWKKSIIQTYGETYFKTMCKMLLMEGKLFHSCIKNALTQKEPEISPRMRSTYFSVQPILENIQRVHCTEKYITHPILRYRGIVDCIASYRDHLYVIDWKKSGKQKLSLAVTYDAPVQLAAYIGAINASNDYPCTIDRGLVVVAYTNGEPATIHELNRETLQKAWREWLRRLKEFYVKSQEL